MNYNDIIKDIKSKKYKPLYLLHGEEAYFIDVIAKLLEEVVLMPNEKAFNMTIAYANEVETRQIVDTANQFPMMAPYRLVIIKEAQSLKKLEVLLPYVNAPNPQTILVLCHKHKKVDSRKLIFKALNKSKDSVVFESKKLYDNKIPGWIAVQMNTLGYQIESQASMLMSEYLGTDLSKITNEIEKLIIHMSKDNPITVKDIRNHIGISKDFNVFEFQNVLGKRDLKKALRMVNYFADNPKSAPMPVITGSLYGYLMKLLMTKTNNSKSNQELASIIGGSPYFMQSYKTAAANYAIEELQLSIDHLAQLDLKSKGIGLRSMKYRGLLQEFVYNLIAK